MDYKRVGITRHGIQFVWNGDDVMWLFWWARSEGKAWISFGFDSTFNSLQEIDALWDEYFEATKHPDGGSVDGK